MTTTLSEGVKVPDVGSVNWAGDLEVNWNLLNGALANLSGNVKLDRDNTWTGEQSFTLPIVGSIAGTASKAIADEDGTSIKTGYGKLAGSQTWTGTNTYTGASAIRFNNTSYVSGTPSENIFYSTVQWGGYVNNTWSAPFTINNAVRTNGYSDISFRTYSQTSNTLTGCVHETNADASDIAFRPIANGTHKLGSSSYQWSSVYAQSYYYNGTAWGLDKANTWTAEQTITNNFFVVKETGYELGQSYPSGSHVSGLMLRDKNGSTVGLIDIVDRSYGNMEMRIRVQQKYDPNSNNRSTSGNILFNELIVGITPDKQNYIGFNADLWGSNHNLGTSTNKWKTLNGVNPGALSLPDTSKSVTVDTTDYTWTGSNNTYVAPADGWLSLKTTTGLSGRLEGTTTGIGSIVERSAGGRLVLLHIPVLKNESVTISGVGSDFILTFYPCLGNV